jgi:hypothetical protein
MEQPNLHGLKVELPMAAHLQYEGRTMAMIYSIESLALANISRFLPNNLLMLD